MRRRRIYGHSSLTSLLDVLFILVFASLAHAMAAGQAAGAQKDEADDAADGAPSEGEAPAAEPPAREEPPRDRRRPGREPADLHDRAVAAVAEEIRGKRPVYARVSREGDLREVEEPAEDVRLELSVRLLEEVPDPDVRVTYVGDRAPDMRLCSILLHHLEHESLQDHLVIIVPDAPIADLSVALVDGLQRDEERCLREQQGLAILVEPRQSHLEKEEP